MNLVEETKLRNILKWHTLRCYSTVRGDHDVYLNDADLDIILDTIQTYVDAKENQDE